MMRMYPASWAVSWAGPSHMVSIQGVKVAAIHTPLTRAPSSTVTEMVALLAVVYRSAAAWVPKARAWRDSRTIPSSLANRVTRVTVPMTLTVWFFFTSLAP